MHVEGRWEDNQFTVEGRHAHRRVDELDHLLPEAGPPSGGGDAKEAKKKNKDEPDPTVGEGGG